MKTFLPLTKATLVLAILTFSFFSQAQTSNELVFQNATLYSGTNGSDNAIYRFPLVNSDVDALVRITGRSSSLVKLSTIDLTNTGFKKAFQPQIEYNNGSVISSANWWMEFEISFVNKNTSVPATINNFNMTGIDIDGDDDKLNEWHSYFGSSSYIIENNSKLTVSNATGTVSSSTQTGMMFTGIKQNYSGVDTTETRIMTTNTYVNRNSLTVRFGATTNGSSSSTDRMYSVWFKSFSYSTPMLSTLPVVLKYFSATLKSEVVSLKWEASVEDNFSHYIVQRSYDGNDYSDIANVFGLNMPGFMNYSYNDAAVNTQKDAAYYRLLMVDKDGKTKYSDIKIIRFGSQKETMSITAFPNPVVNDLRVSIPNSWQGKNVRFDIYNTSGQVVKSVNNNSAGQTETISVNNLTKGFYVVKASNGTESAQQSIIKK